MWSIKRYLFFGYAEPPIWPPFWASFAPLWGFGHYFIQSLDAFTGFARQSDFSEYTPLGALRKRRLLRQATYSNKK